LAGIVKFGAARLHKKITRKIRFATPLWFHRRPLGHPQRILFSCPHGVCRQSDRHGDPVRRQGVIGISAGTGVNLPGKAGFESLDV